MRGFMIILYTSPNITITIKSRRMVKHSLMFALLYLRVWEEIALHSDNKFASLQHHN